MNVKVCLENSMASRYPEIAKEWHPTKNILTPNDILPGSNVKYWWRCTVNTAHEWLISPNVRCIKLSNCPHCFGKTTFGGNTILDKFPEIAKEWHPTKNGELKPEKICPKSMTKIWWICPKNHEYKSICANRTYGRKSGCPYCKGKLVNSENSLDGCYPDIAKEWHTIKNKTKPSEYTCHSGKKVWWKCSKNPEHEWLIDISNRTSHGTGCPYCNVSHMEKIVKHYFETLNIKIEQQKRFTNMGLGKLSYDFYLPEKNILIECDGQQHFKEYSNYFHRYSSFNYQRIRDVRKNVFALKNKIPLLRIAYTEEKFINSILTAFISRVERGFKGIVFSNYKLYKKRE